MKLPYSEPVPSGSKRAELAREFRYKMADVAYSRPKAKTLSNQEEADHGSMRSKTDSVKPSYPANFTKGLYHNQFGLLEDSEDYRLFVQAINAPDPNLFETLVISAQTKNVAYSCSKKETCHGGEEVKWRGWESPRSGHSLLGL